MIFDSEPESGRAADDRDPRRVVRHRPRRSIPPPQYGAGRGAVWLLIGLLERHALTPNLQILNRLTAMEIALLKRSDRAWTLPRDCDDRQRREAEAEALLRTWDRKNGVEHE